MTRVALLPAGGDPFLNAYWLRHYARVWADEVDELIVYACGVEAEAMPYLSQLVASLPHARLLAISQRSDHGIILGRLLDLYPDVFDPTSTDYIMLCEDDAFVRRSGVVDAAFARIESGEVDIVGTPRGNAPPRLTEAAEAEWGPIPPTLTGEAGLSLYPCFYFGRRTDLMATDRHFGAVLWSKGDVIPGLEIKAAEGEAADTFVSTSWQLRRAGLRIALEPTHRTNRATMDTWSTAPWFHVGSLSSGFGSAFSPGQPHRPAYVESIRGDTDEWAKRVAWWIRAWDCWDGEIPEYHAAYRLALDAFTADAGIASGAAAEWRRRFDPLVSWDERP